MVEFNYVVYDVRAVRLLLISWEYNNKYVRLTACVSLSFDTLDAYEATEYGDNFLLWLPSFCQ